MATPLAPVATRVVGLIAVTALAVAAVIDIIDVVIVLLFVNAIVEALICTAAAATPTDGKNTPQNAADDAAAIPAMSDRSLSQLSRVVIVSCADIEEEEPG